MNLKRIVNKKHKVEIIIKKSPAPLSFQFYLLGLRKIETSQVKLKNCKTVEQGGRLNWNKQTAIRPQFNPLRFFVLTTCWHSSKIFWQGFLSLKNLTCTRFKSEMTISCKLCVNDNPLKRICYQRHTFMIPRFIFWIFF